MRGFRWQLAALIFSLFIFGLALGNRVINSPQPPAATQTPRPPTASPVPGTDTPIPVDTPVPAESTIAPTPDTDAIQHDDIPTFHEALIGSVQRLNPLLADLNPVDQDITSLIFEGLTRINEYGEPEGALADNWIISADGLEYVFTLRQDVLWQDGVAFSADDVIYTMSLLSSSDFPGNQESGAFWRTVEIWKLNNFQIRFRLTQPLSSFPSLLTIGILPEHALRGTSAAQLASHPFNFSPIGTGAYQLEALLANNSGVITRVDLRPAPAYQQRASISGDYPIKRLSFHLFTGFDEALAALESGIVDALAARTMQERLPLVNTGLPSYTTIAPAVGLLIFNHDEGDGIRFFQESRVRIALQGAVNRSSPVESRLANQAILADSPLLPHSWAYTDNLLWQPYNLSNAQSILERSNIQTVAVAEATEEGAEPPPQPTIDPSAPLYRFSILVPDNPALIGLAQEIATQWSQLNLEITVESAPVDAYQARLENGEFMSAIVELPVGADPDVYAYWHVGQYPDGANYGAAADDRLSEILERARHEIGGVSRAHLYEDFQELFIERAIALPLYYPLYTYVVRDDIQGVQLSFISTPSDRFRGIESWAIAPDS